MAVDANVLIFERLKEEVADGKHLHPAIEEGFSRAWSSIRDGNGTSILAAGILYFLSGTSLVKGFCLVFAIGVAASIISAVLASRVLLLAFPNLPASAARRLVGASANRK
jgi:preprotein translocase subunit SecD